jgi:hypothetical protein
LKAVAKEIAWATRAKGSLEGMTTGHKSPAEIDAAIERIDRLLEA